MSNSFRVYQSMVLRKGETFTFEFEVHFTNELCDFEIDTEEIEKVLTNAFSNYLKEKREHDLI